MLHTKKTAVRAVVLCALASSLLFLSPTSIAALVDRDWKIAGDANLILDTGTGLEWLDLSVTMDQSYNQVSSMLQSGGMYASFRYATQSEVLQLWSATGINNTNFVWVDNGEWAMVKDLADRLGTSTLFDNAGAFTHALGMVEGGAPLPANERWVMELAYKPSGVDVRTSSEHYTLDTAYHDIHYSSYLVRPVPAPAAVWLLGSGLFGLLGVARRKA